MSEGYKPTEPDDLMVCLSLMDEHWPGYQNAKGIIRDHAVRMRAELRRQSQELERAREALGKVDRMVRDAHSPRWEAVGDIARAALTQPAPEKP